MAERPLTTFTETLDELRRGKLTADLTAELTGLVAAVREHGTAGKLTLTLTVAPAASGEVAALIITDQITIKPPKIAKQATILYASDNGTLSKNDPRQPELLNLREPADPTPFRVVDRAGE
jgi:hypothetical protein